MITFTGDTEQVRLALAQVLPANGWHLQGANNEVTLVVTDPAVDTSGITTAMQMADYGALARAAAMRLQRDQLIDAMQWRIARYQQQTAVAIATDDTTATYSAWLAYAQALRDVPAQAGFPDSIAWPVAPA